MRSRLSRTLAVLAVLLATSFAAPPAPAQDRNGEMGAAAGGAPRADSPEYASVRDKLALCFGCHGANGASADPRYPILAGQQFYYLYVQLKDFKSGLRKNQHMGAVARQLEKQEMQTLAKFFSEQQWPRRAYTASPQARKRAESMVVAAACIACHLTGFKGNSRVPRLAGQIPAYLHKTMLDFKNKARTNAPSMTSMLDKFSDEDLKSMAEYLSAL